MRNFLLVLLFVIFGISSFFASAQDATVSPSLVGVGVYHGLSKPLKDLPAMNADDFRKMQLQADVPRNEELQNRSYPFAETALPVGPDPAWQKEMGSVETGKAPIVSFDGQTSPYYPSDANGATGPNHFMQTINATYSIYNKTGTRLVGPTNLNLLFGNVPGSTCNNGDPIVLYDEQADRWMVAEFSICGSNDYMLVAVSQTNDPTGAWHKYSFDVADMPDYEKFGIWQDGYYMATNNSSGKDIYVFERSKMLIGGTAQMVGFDNPWRPSTIDGFVCVPPVDNDGAFAPAGSPGLFVAFNDDAIGGGSDQIWIYELTVNWTTPASSTFGRVQQLAVASFDSNFGTNWDNIKQPGTTRELDAIPQVVMNVPQYRNFGTYQTMVLCHTVDVDNTDHAGIRWYELRKTASTWSVRQQGTYAPDAHSRWMGSISLSGYNTIGLGYSISSTTLYPGIRYTGQSSTEYSNGSGTLDVAEQIITTGTNSQTAYNRWGDYSSLCLDPTDDFTFWYTNQYISASSARKTRIASFQIGAAPTPIDLTWDGSENNDWATAENWTPANVPSSDYNIVLLNNSPTHWPLTAGTPESPSVCHNLSIGEEAIITIPAGKALTVGGTLTNYHGNAGLIIESDETGTGSLIHNSDNIGAFFDRYITGNSNIMENAYHQVAVPLESDNEVSGLFEGSYLFRFDVASQEWVGMGAGTTTLLDKNTGYLIYYPGDNIVYSFEGNLRNGPITLFSSAGLTNNHFIVPNPYPSAIDWDANSGWTKSNLYDAFWVWNPVVKNYAAYGTEAGTNGASRYIPQGQAFFVKAQAAGATLALNNSVRVHNGQAFFKSAAGTENMISITATANDGSDETIIRFRPDATNSLDNWDVAKLYGDEEVPQLYSMADENMLSISSLPMQSGFIVVPLYFETQFTGLVTLNFSGLESFDPSATIFLKDELTNNTINLAIQEVYTFNHNPENEANRFKLFFGGTTSIDEPLVDLGKIWISGNSIYISAPDLKNQEALIEVFNPAGQRLLAKTLVLDELTTLDLYLKGFVIMKLTSGEKVMTTKEILIK